MFQLNKKKIIIIAFIALTIVVAMLFYLLSGKKQAFGDLSVTSSPLGGTFTIDNETKEYKAPTTIKGLAAQKHIIHAKFPGLVDINQEINIEANKETKIELNFSTGGTEPNVIKNSIKSYQEYISKHPLVKYLPYKTSLYKMEYAEPNTDTYYVWVYSGDKADIEPIKKELFAWIKSKGINPEALKIEWKI